MRGRRLQSGFSRGCGCSEWFLARLAAIPGRVNRGGGGSWRLARIGSASAKSGRIQVGRRLSQSGRLRRCRVCLRERSRHSKPRTFHKTFAPFLASHADLQGLAEIAPQGHTSSVELVMPHKSNDDLCCAIVSDTNF